VFNESSENFFTIENHRHTGWVEVICGSMFSGKTEELIRRINRALIAKQTVRIFKPKIDNRYHPSDIVSHSELSKEAIAIETANELLAYIQPNDVVAIDEAQFFSLELLAICQKLANNKHRVIVAGLDTDFKGEPFGPVPQLMAMAEFVTKLHAICTTCGNMANFTYRISNEDKSRLVGAADTYEARCRNCFNKSLK